MNWSRVLEVRDTSYWQAVPSRYDQQQLCEYLFSTISETLHMNEWVFAAQDTNLNILPSHSMTFNGLKLTRERAE